MSMVTLPSCSNRSCSHHVSNMMMAVQCRGSKAVYRRVRASESGQNLKGGRKLAVQLYNCSMNSYIDSSKIHDSASPPSSFGPTRQHATSIDSLGSPALHYSCTGTAVQLYHATLTANQPALLFSRFGNWVAQPHLLAISGRN